jgi:hypothetical protein
VYLHVALMQLQLTSDVYVQNSFCMYT